MNIRPTAQSETRSTPLPGASGRRIRIVPGLILLSLFLCKQDICAMSMEIPYAKVRTTVLTQKQYREAGERIATALMHRIGR